MEWLKQQGPWCPALHEYLERNHQNYDVLIFFTYLYAPTVLGVEDRAAQEHPRADGARRAGDPPRDLQGAVQRARPAIAYNTDVERRFLTTHFSIRAVEEETVGCGVDLPQSQMHQRDRPDDADDAERSRRGRGRRGDEDRPPSWRPHLAGRGVVFRRRHRLHGPIALYGGRIDPGKGCEELIEYFSSYVQDGGDASLVLMGVKLMPLPEDPFIRFAGRLSDEERLQALEAATVVVVPVAVREPVAARARSPSPSARRSWPTPAARCSSITARRATPASTTRIATSSWNRMKLLVGDQRLRAAMGRNGRAYVRQELPLGRDPGEVRADVRQAARPLTRSLLRARSSGRRFRSAGSPSRWPPH